MNNSSVGIGQANAVQAKAQRNSSVELLRIVAMLFIVLSHLCVHSGFELSALPFSFNKLLLGWGTLGNLGVNIFVIISGYFLCVKTVNVKGISKLLTQVWFYSWVLFAVAVLVFKVDVSLKSAVTALFPTIFNEYWFFTAYIVLFLLSPFINTLIQSLNRQNFLRLLLCTVVLWVVIPTFTNQPMYGTEIPQFVTLYLIGAYFRKHPENLFSKKRNRVLLLAICTALLLLSVVALNLLATRYPATHFYSRTSVLVVGVAVGLFALSVYHTPFSNRFINAVSSCTFGVYLIHDNPFVRQILWKQTVRATSFYFSPFFFAYGLLAVVLVFVACTLIEFVRQKTVAKPMSNALEKLLSLILRLFSLKKKEQPDEQAKH